MALTTYSTQIHVDHRDYEHDYMYTQILGNSSRPGNGHHFLQPISLTKRENENMLGAWNSPHSANGWCFWSCAEPRNMLETIFQKKPHPETYDPIIPKMMENPKK